MAHKHEDSLKQIVEGLDGLQKRINKLADANRSDLGFIATRVTNRLQTEKAFINSLRGMSTAPVTAAHDINKPVATVMGQPVEVRKPVAVEDITPTDVERDNYLREVSEMYEGFEKLVDEDIVKKYELGGENVIRGVAKRAGVPHYGTATIDVLFVKSIREAMKATAEREEAIRKAEKSITEKKS